MAARAKAGASGAQLELWPRPAGAPPVRRRRARVARRAEVRALQLRFAALVFERPRIRAECSIGPRPCPWVGCRHHLYLDVVKRDQVKLNHEPKEPWELAETCSLDVVRANPEGLSQDQVAPLLGISRPRVHQNQEEAVAKLKAALQGRPLDVLPARDEWDELIDELEEGKGDGDQDE